MTEFRRRRIDYEIAMIQVMDNGTDSWTLCPAGQDGPRTKEEALEAACEFAKTYPVEIRYAIGLATGLTHTIYAIGKDGIPHKLGVSEQKAGWLH